ncbi:MAG TPA: hypothetical protein VFS43_13705 [Polyangiaceae bacterium]|nr:hypothetical protein [Polyangiaceae bacterium]
MLEALDRVTWADYRHAYGPAVDVPELLRALAFGDERAQGRAKYALYGNLWHQGTVYEASAHAVAFLIEMLAPGSSADKAFVLQYLGDLASGSSYLAAHQGFAAYDGLRDGPEFRAELEREIDWVRATHEAVLRGAPMYLALARGHADPDVRSAAFRLLARFREEAPELAGHALEASRGDGDEVVRASALLAFDWLCPEPARVRAECAARLAGDRSEFVRWLAAWAWAASAREQTPPAAVDVLATALAVAPRFEARLVRLGWFDADATAVTARALGALGPLHARAYVPRLVAALRAAAPSAALALADALLGLAFGAPFKGGSFASMTPPQKAAAAAIATSDQAWALRAALAELLRAYGLPDERGRLREFVGAGG